VKEIARRIAALPKENTRRERIVIITQGTFPIPVLSVWTNSSSSVEYRVVLPDFFVGFRILWVSEIRIYILSFFLNIYVKLGEHGRDLCLMSIITYYKSGEPRCGCSLINSFCKNITFEGSDHAVMHLAPIYWVETFLLHQYYWWKYMAKNSVADPDPGFGMGKKSRSESGIRIRDQEWKNSDPG
jgi:hypothetical protein